MARLGFSDRHFTLRMGRADIASFLALRHETVSRAQSRLDALGYIAVRCREVKLLDPAELQDCAGSPCTVH